MITEDYVSLEVAKLLKEKGFYQDFLNEITPIWKLNGNKEELVFYGDDNYPCEWEEWYFAPTLQMACKWLREVHNFSVEIFSIKGTSNVCPILWKGNVVELLAQERAFSGELVYSYEEAVEAALKYTLENLI